MYTIIELQTNNGATIVATPVVKATLDEARQEYHLKASYAAVSSVEIHTIILLNAEGQPVERVISYKHPVQE